MFNGKYGDLVQLKNSKDIGIIIDDFEKEVFEEVNVAFISHMGRKILLFKETGPEIDIIPSFNLDLIKKEKNDTTV